jgi:hypothetical protein
MMFTNNTTRPYFIPGLIYCQFGKGDYSKDPFLYEKKRAMRTRPLRVEQNYVNKVARTPGRHRRSVVLAIAGIRQA